MFKIAFINKHTHESQYLQGIDGEDYAFKTIKEAEKQLACLSSPRENARFVIVEQYYA